MRSRPASLVKARRPDSPEKLFTQVIEAARPALLKLWEEGDFYFPKGGVQCPGEIVHEKTVGRSYYQCNPHFWQCYWEGGVRKDPVIEIDLFGQTFHIVAKQSFDPLSAYSPSARYIQSWKGPGLNLKYGYLIEVGVREIPGYSQPMLLADSCRDTYLPQRIYGYGKVKGRRDEGFIWDNFGRHIFIDRFYVTNRQINEWRLLTNAASKIEPDRKKWHHPAFLTLKEQKEYCAFFGKKLLEAKLFDAAAMTPAELKNPLPTKVLRPETPWQRDLSKTFLGMSRINPDYQLTPLDCSLAQVQGCHEKYFTADSATWMGMNYALGFFPESLMNNIEPEKNIKKSSRFMAPASTWHELGILGEWNGTQSSNEPVAFRCYEEVEP